MEVFYNKRGQEIYRREPHKLSDGPYSVFVELVMSDDTVCSRWATLSPETGILCVHSGFASHRNGITVSHNPTGMSLVSFERFPQAWNFMCEIESISHWWFTEPDSPVLTELIPQMKTIANRIGGILT